MNKCCRTCKHFSNGLCYHPEMSTEEHDVYSEYVEPLFENVTHANSDTERILDFFMSYLKDNLPVGKMNFSPADHREFYCSLYE